ncbi:MAG: MmcQ/YjbR family DNA-binding protein [Pseudomonadales bacterium]
MARNISDVVREICLGLPEATEVSSHGSPDFRVGKHTFATYAINHHGDGRIALWLNMPSGAQQLYVEAEPGVCFVPPYVGPRGWLGVQLDRGMDWSRIAALVREAYARVASPDLVARMGPPVDVEPPLQSVDPEEFDPLSPPRVQELLGGLRERCLHLPEVTETEQFGNPAWRAGKKTFCTASRYRRRLQLHFWVGAEQQSQLTMDERFTIPAYLGHNGWIALDAEDGVMWPEVESLLLTSYRHFALKRMLKALPA